MFHLQSPRLVHRADYHKVLLDAAVASGAYIRLGASVRDVDLTSTSVELDDGEKVFGDMIVGADGEKGEI